MTRALAKYVHIVSDWCRKLTHGANNVRLAITLNITIFNPEFLGIRHRYGPERSLLMEFYRSPNLRC